MQYQSALALWLLIRSRTVSAGLKHRWTLSQSITTCTSPRLLSDVASWPLPATATGDSPPAFALPGPRSSGSSGNFEHNANSSSICSSLKDPELVGFWRSFEASALDESCKTCFHSLHSVSTFRLDFEVASITLISITWTQVISDSDVAVGMQHHGSKLDEMSFWRNVLVCNHQDCWFCSMSNMRTSLGLLQ